MTNQPILFRDLGKMDYQAAWDYQESLLRENVRIKTEAAYQREEGNTVATGTATTIHYLLFTEHPPVYTLGKSGNISNVLISDEEMKERNIQFYNTNRGGDITFHGPGQIVGYPIFDLEKFDTDIGKYLRNLEEVIILTLAEYGIAASRSAGETGVWIEPGVAGKERKICAIGVRCSRWITMHGFALNVNTDLSFFNHIIPCGITNKQVTSLEKECGHTMDMEEVKGKIRRNVEKVFEGRLIME
ncbi:MAG: lipoyl(octanoyl) transferase LipB [Bacteroidetes bacterium]|nr:lipoyl(octanoyl) transferase LipB [Bacteroidota bacterium]